MGPTRVLGLTAALLAGAVLGRLSAPEAESAPLVQAAPSRAAAPVVTTVACAPASVDEGSDKATPTERSEHTAADEHRAALEAAQTALATEHDPQRQSELIREIVAQKAQYDLGTAWTWLLQHRADPGYAENARNLLYQWSYAKPEHVAALLPQVTSGEAQAAAAQQLAQLWNKKDPHAFHSWVASLPEGPLKTAARSPY